MCSLPEKKRNPRRPFVEKPIIHSGAYVLELLSIPIFFSRTNNVVFTCFFSSPPCPLQIDLIAYVSLDGLFDELLGERMLIVVNFR